MSLREKEANQFIKLYDFVLNEDIIQSDQIIRHDGERKHSSIFPFVFVSYTRIPEYSGMSVG